MNKVAIALGMVRDKPKSQYWASFLKDVMSFFLSKCCSDFTPDQSWVQYVLESRNKKLFEELFDILRSKTKAGTLRLVAFSLVGMGLLSEDQEYCEGVYNYPYLYRPGPKRVHSGVPKFEGRCFICDAKCETCSVRTRVPFTGRCSPCLNSANGERFVCREAIISMILCLKKILVVKCEGSKIPAKNVIDLIVRKVWDDKHVGDEWRFLYQRIFWKSRRQILDVEQYKNVIRLVRHYRDECKMSWEQISYNLCKVGITEYALLGFRIEKMYDTKL